MFFTPSYCKTFTHSSGATNYTNFHEVDLTMLLLSLCGKSKQAEK